MPGKMPEVSSRNGIKVFLEGGPETELFAFGSIMIPSVDQRLLYVPVVGDPVEYKVEKVFFRVKEMPSIGTEPTDLEPYASSVEVTVSLVP